MQKKIFQIIHILLIVLLAGAILAFAGLALWQLADLFPQREDRARIQAMNAVLAEHKEEIPTDASGPEAALAVLAENGYTDFSLQQREGELYYLRNTRTLYVKASMEGSWYYTAALDHTYRTSDIDLFRGELNVIVTSLFSGSQYDFYLFGGAETAASLRTRVGEDLSLAGGEGERAALTEYFTHTLFYDGSSLFTYRAEGDVLVREEAEEIVSPRYFGYELCVEEGVSSIPADLLSGAYVTSVNLSDSVTEIGERAFSDCAYLEEVTFSSALLRIGAGAFENCRALYAADLPSGLEEVGARAFAGCEGLARLRIPRSLAAVPEDAFSGCEQAMRSVPVRFYLGSEIYYYPGMADDLAAGKLLPFGGSRTVLVEFSTRQETEIADIVYDLGVAGYRPIVAHIERYWYLKKEDYFLIRESGGRIQINAGAFAHEHTAKTAMFLLKQKLVDAIASDAHDDARRPVDFALAQKTVRRKFPRQYRALFESDFRTFTEDN